MLYTSRIVRKKTKKIWFEAGQARWNREQEMLRRLIDIRDYLYS